VLVAADSKLPTSPPPPPPPPLPTPPSSNRTLHTPTHPHPPTPDHTPTATHTQPPNHPPRKHPLAHPNTHSYLHPTTHTPSAPHILRTALSAASSPFSLLQTAAVCAVTAACVVHISLGTALATLLTLVPAYIMTPPCTAPPSLTPSTSAQTYTQPGSDSSTQQPSSPAPPSSKHNPGSGTQRPSSPAPPSSKHNLGSKTNSATAAATHVKHQITHQSHTRASPPPSLSMTREAGGNCSGCGGIAHTAAASHTACTARALQPLLHSVCLLLLAGCVVVAPSGFAAVTTHSFSHTSLPACIQAFVSMRYPYSSFVSLPCINILKFKLDSTALGIHTLSHTSLPAYIQAFVSMRYTYSSFVSLPCINIL